MSTLSWLDFDEAAARRSRELAKALADRETVDSLGIGSIRDGLADVLFPGTSTIQNRARYFLLVPWTMQEVERRFPKDRAQYDRWLRQLEVQTIGALLEGSIPGTTGIIGSQKRGATKRLASSVYWSGIGEWGIRVDRDLSMSAHRQYAMSRRGKQLKDEFESLAAYRVWDEMPPAPDDFPGESLNVLPSAAESNYLLEKMRQTIAGGHARSKFSSERSLLAHVAQSPTSTKFIEPWDIPLHGEAPLVSEAMRHSRWFAIVIQGARLRYDQLLFDACRTADIGLPAGADAREAELSALVDEWVELVQEDEAELADRSTDLADLVDLLLRFGTRVPTETRKFVSDWMAEALSDPEQAMKSRRTADLVRGREQSIKGPAARLTNAAPLQAWQGGLFGTGYLDYRWSTARGLIRDCKLGLESTDAGS